jgi:GDP-mannose transporter
MILANKAITTSVPEDLRNAIPKFSVILFQTIIATILVSVAKMLKYVEYPAFDTAVALQWLPVNVFFVGMLCSGFFSLMYANVAMVQVFKNLTNIVTVSGDSYLFGEQLSVSVFVAISVMTTGAYFASVNDVEFNVTGYVWMSLNCLLTAGYVLYMRYASTSIKLPKFGMVFYNNLLCSILVLPFILLFNELPMWTHPDIMNTQFIVMNVIAGVLGFFLNFASLWCVSETSASTYAIVGSLCKIPVTVLGVVLFDAPITEKGAVFISMSIFGGLIYCYAKLPK